MPVQIGGRPCGRNSRDFESSLTSASLSRFTAAVVEAAASAALEAAASASLTAWGSGAAGRIVRVT
jgi:hypothetical protein